MAVIGRPDRQPERPGLGVGSMGGRNTSFFEEKECGDEAASADLLLGGTAIRDLGPVAARGVDEFDRPAV